MYGCHCEKLSFTLLQCDQTLHIIKTFSTETHVLLSFYVGQHVQNDKSAFNIHVFQLCEGILSFVALKRDHKFF